MPLSVGSWSGRSAVFVEATVVALAYCDHNITSAGTTDDHPVSSVSEVKDVTSICNWETA